MTPTDWADHLILLWDGQEPGERWWLDDGSTLKMGGLGAAFREGARMARKRWGEGERPNYGPMAASDVKHNERLRKAQQKRGTP